MLLGGLDRLDASLLYDFQGYGVDDSAVTASRRTPASGFTEQVAVLVCKDEDAAGQVKSLPGQYLSDMKDSYKGLRPPPRCPKLDAAILEQQGARPCCWWSPMAQPRPRAPWTAWANLHILTV